MIPNWLFIIMLLGGSGVISAVVTLIVSFSIEKKKNRPDVISHCCRICNLDVYTCYDEKNKMSTPSCVHLSPSDSQSCLFPITGEENGEKQDKKRMSRNNKGKCYLVAWARKINNQEYA